MRTPKNRNMVFAPLSYESVFSHLNELERDIELNEPTDSHKRLVPISVCTIIEQFCRVRKMFAYRDGEPMPQKLRLNMVLVRDMLARSDGWCVDNADHHAKILDECVKDAGDDGYFTISVADLDILIDRACSIRPPLMVESLVASTLNFQGVEAVNSLNITEPILHPDGEIGVEEYEMLFDTRHAKTHTLASEKFSPRACIALAKDLFVAMLGRDDFLLHRGRALSNAGRHSEAVDCLGRLHGRKDLEYLTCYGRSLAHVRDSKAANTLQRAANSLQEYVENIPEHKPNSAAWLRMEAASTMCDIADGFKVAGGGHKSHVSKIFDICLDSADAYCLAGDRLGELKFPPNMSLKCYKSAYKLVQNINTAYWVGITCFEMKRYKDAKKWFKKAKKHDEYDTDVKNALEQVDIRLAAVANKQQ